MLQGMCVQYSGILGHRCGSRYPQLCAYSTFHLSTFSPYKFEGYVFCFRCVSGLRPDKWVLMQQDVWWFMQVSELVRWGSYTFLDFTFSIVQERNSSHLTSALSCLHTWPSSLGTRWYYWGDSMLRSWDKTMRYCSGVQKVLTAYLPSL